MLIFFCWPQFWNEIVSYVSFDQTNMWRISFIASHYCAPDTQWARRSFFKGRTLEFFQRQRWENVWETGWSAYGLFRAHDTILNWIKLTCTWGVGRVCFVTANRSPSLLLTLSTWRWTEHLRGPSSVRRTLELFQRQRWGNVWERRGGAHTGFSERRDTILN